MISQLYHVRLKSAMAEALEKVTDAAHSVWLTSIHRGAKETAILAALKPFGRWMHVSYVRIVDYGKI